MTDTKSIRTTLRARFRALRQSLSPNAQQQASEALALACNSLSKNTQVVALYLPNDGEIDPTLAIKHLWQHNKHVLLPVIDPNNKGHLIFQRYEQDTKLPLNQYGIPEPKYDPAEIVDITTIDIIFMPLVGFDSQGNRLGMGGGYYDRTLSAVAPHKPVLIGLAHDCQQVDRLPVEVWDIPLHIILTPSQKLITKHGEKLFELPL
ncbi:5-formyltetrahydrofolate cyclo-ligase [Psychrosphaera sp. B3R10]|uniref:5-formyltetrahydrofolate cyclo-ligase n=1 Tax=unclassified Psychrosphaera TaxID=2641570 RepID=UPI001C09C91C|nr:MULTISPECIES: 5-formyltetrahydrofolate cyclo-ligase [unclassified Psychrosphaera]MBU2881637.1 5-formyltetrahydrofolate cyclo-ligase [Psychrosphaera sp. I2R16]MBU2991108.1 5-formyltetrahydrofolate cyclo-ligase [Psychrosphaera sp. B3R10]MDO6721461.1 5-formyltetrahydrofolate cyclo-ligase [Psychrosphaera sp. 1_MG-2023]